MLMLCAITLIIIFVDRLVVLVCVVLH